jgi:hypothetical protein
MREMSASSAQQSSLAVAVGVTTTESAEVPLRATEPQAAGAPTPASIPTTAAPPVTVAHPSWRLAITGYLLLILATALVCIIPSLHLHSAFGEAALVLLGIVTLVAGAGMATACFIRDMIRKL